MITRVAGALDDAGLGGVAKSKWPPRLLDGSKGMKLRWPALVLAWTFVSLAPSPLAVAQTQATAPSVPGTWTIKDVWFGKPVPGYAAPTPAQKRQLLRRVGTGFEIARTCAGGSVPRQMQELISAAELARPTSGRTQHVVDLGIVPPGQSVWQLSQMCGNVFAWTFYWVPGSTQIVGGHSANDLFEYEFVLERASAAGRPARIEEKGLAALSGIWVPVGEYPRGCAPSTAWIASTDQAIKIESRMISRYEVACAVQSTSALQDGSLRVVARCGFANESHQSTLILRLDQGRLTMRDKTGTKVYAKCQR